MQIVHLNAKSLARAPPIITMPYTSILDKHYNMYVPQYEPPLPELGRTHIHERADKVKVCQQAETLEHLPIGIQVVILRMGTKRLKSINISKLLVDSIPRDTRAATHSKS